MRKVTPGQLATLAGLAGAVLALVLAAGSGGAPASHLPWNTLAAWSPDGKTIAYTGYRPPNVDIWLMDAAGKHQRRLTTNAADDFRPAWSPDGRKIAFSSTRSGNQDIFVMNRDGSGQTQLTNSPAEDRWPAWSPDGKSIAFSSDREGNTQIYAIDADGSGHGA
jgi:Tol biopolymer transport system component